MVEQRRERQLSQQPLAAPCRQRTERLLQILPVGGEAFLCCQQPLAPSHGYKEPCVYNEFQQPFATPCVREKVRL